MDYHKTLAAAGGKEMLKEALIDAILQAIPALGDRKRIEVPTIYEGSINAAIRIHPPTDGSSYTDGSDNLRQLTAAEVLLALQEQLAEPLSSLRTGPFGEYASYTTIGLEGDSRLLLLRVDILSPIVNLSRTQPEHRIPVPAPQAALSSTNRKMIGLRTASLAIQHFQLVQSSLLSLDAL
ncbi:uncharacterized protein EMH_0014070 [Eimeria mitis]|uniref:Uncharacterized protein n=1 Tax=Eimeria mitis TaxID=44415 RepID=U6K577_9EIME|nr:uncharacterized protein EMH_0014070 [Eimeria mitis]CDJ32890.1 hypothetical protein, conserved [Eimeria mitis]